MTISENIEMLARRNMEGKKGCRNLKQKNIMTCNHVQRNEKFRVNCYLALPREKVGKNKTKLDLMENK